MLERSNRDRTTGRSGTGGGRFRAGFTIVELMFVIVIVTVLATVAAPSFLGVKQTDDLVRASNEVKRAFELARSRAILKNVATRVVVRVASVTNVPNLRVDESPDSTCDGWDRIAADATDPRYDPNEATVEATCDTWADTQEHRCGIYEAHIRSAGRSPRWIAYPGYKETDVRFTLSQVSTVANNSFVVCMNRRGRMFVRTGATGDWIPVVQGVRFRLDRFTGGTAMGLTKEIFIPQGAAAGVVR